MKKCSKCKQGFKRVEQYDVDSTPYNEIYQNLDIYSMPEFCNFNSNIDKPIQLTEDISET